METNVTTVPRPAPGHPTTGLLSEILLLLERHGHQPISGRALAAALPQIDGCLVHLVAVATEGPAGVAGV